MKHGVAGFLSRAKQLFTRAPACNAILVNGMIEDVISLMHALFGCEEPVSPGAASEDGFHDDKRPPVETSTKLPQRTLIFSRPPRLQRRVQQQSQASMCQHQLICGEDRDSLDDDKSGGEVISLAADRPLPLLDEDGPCR